MGIPLDTLSSKDLAAVNKRLAWVSGTTDSKGRVLGAKDKIYPIPHPKVVVALTRLGLAGKGVVEFGCLEGAHTVALCRAAAHVTALEARSSNIEKTRVRCGLYGVKPTVIQADVETDPPPAADVFFHSGVLYHLQDPIGHLLKICPLTQEMVLDTHYAKNPDVRYKCAVDGKEYSCWIYGETVSGHKAGMRGFSRWLRRDDIVDTLKRFFHDVQIAHDEVEGNGPRVSIVAKRRKE